MKVDENTILVAFLLLFLAIVCLRSCQSYTEDSDEDYSNESVKIIMIEEPSVSSEKDFYSLYGWRTNPPFKYPQSTIDTPYDETMEQCVESNRFQLHEPGQWQEKCSLLAAQAQRKSVL